MCVLFVCARVCVCLCVYIFASSDIHRKGYSLIRGTYLCIVSAGLCQPFLTVNVIQKAILIVEIILLYILHIFNNVNISPENYSLCVCVCVCV